MSTAAIAYSLFWDFSHIRGEGHDAALVRFPGWDNTLGLLGREHREVPKPVLFEANFKVMQHSDYPGNDVQWPLMSPRMLDVLRQADDFPHRLIPVRLVNRRALGPARYLSDKSLRPEVVNDRFAAVQLTQHLDVVDWEHSVFEKSQLGNATFYDFDKLVLVEPPGGLPPLFRVREEVSLLLVSAEARRALEEAGIRGVDFDPLPGAGQDSAAS